MPYSLKCGVVNKTDIVRVDDGSPKHLYADVERKLYKELDFKSLIIKFGEGGIPEPGCLIESTIKIETEINVRSFHLTPFGRRTVMDDEPYLMKSRQLLEYPKCTSDALFRTLLFQSMSRHDISGREFLSDYNKLIDDLSILDGRTRRIAS